MIPTFCLTIDLDPLPCYRRIWGLPEPAAPGPEPAAPGPEPVTAIASERFVELARELGGTGTLFAVGQALSDPAAARALRAAHADGFEVANHSLSHRYDLSRLPAAAIAAEVEGGAAAIERVLGKRPLGFRAPGYLLGPRVLPALAAAGARYDSSVLPSPAYAAVKAAALGALALAGRPSASIRGDPREALAPRRPYRPDPERPWRAGRLDLLELPISAPLGLPLTGALLLLAPGPLRALLGALCARSAWVCLELHGVDLLDGDEPGIEPALRSAVRELRLPWAEKRARLLEWCAPLALSHRLVRLGDVGRV